jgi:hypothetical protein
MRTHSVIVACLVCFTGCAVTLPGGGGFTDATTPTDQRPYDVIGRTEATVFSTLFLWQHGVPDIELARQLAASRVGGDALIDVVWEIERRNYYVFGKLGVTVRGTAIKFRDGQTSSVPPGGVPEAQTKAAAAKEHSIQLGLAVGPGRTEPVPWYGSDGKAGRGVSLTYRLATKDRRVSFAPAASLTRGDRLTSLALTGGVRAKLRRADEGGASPYLHAGVNYSPAYLRYGDSMTWLQFGWGAGAGATVPLGQGLGLDVSLSRQGLLYSHERSIREDSAHWRLGAGVVLYR